MADSAYDIADAFKAIEDELIKSMIRNMARHKAEETKEGYNWEQWQALQLKALEQYKKRNREKFGDRFGELNHRISELIKTMNTDGQMEQEAKVLEAIKKGFKGQRVSKGMTAEFFKTNDRKLNALIKATTDDMKKAEVAVLRMADDQYRKVIYKAQVYANTGAGTYEKAIDMATKDFVAAGLNCVEYSNGARHTLSDYAEMAIRTATKRAYLQGEGTMRQTWGIPTVIMNRRMKACPKCLPFQGKVFIDDVWSGGAADGRSPETGKKYPLLSSAIAAGLYHPRCQDSHTTYFEGISTPPSGKITRKQVEAAEEGEREEAKKQNARRQRAKHKRLAETRLGPENRQEERIREDRWGREADNLRRKADLSTDPLERLFFERQANGMEGISESPEVQRLFRRARFKSGEREIRCVDITKEFLEAAKPGEGSLMIDPNTEIDDQLTTKWLHKLFGGNIHCLCENSSIGKMPDALWDGEYWEYKAPSTIKAIDTRIRKGNRQLEEALLRENRKGERRGIVIDVREIIESRETIIKTISQRAIQRYKGPTTIIVKAEEQLICVMAIK